MQFGLVKEDAAILAAGAILLLGALLCVVALLLIIVIQHFIQNYLWY